MEPEENEIQVLDAEIGDRLEQVVKLKHKMFERMYNLRVGDMVVVTDTFRDHVKSMRGYRYVLDGIPVGKECEITALNIVANDDPLERHWGRIEKQEPRHSIVVPAKMLQEMYATWLAQAEPG